MQIFCYLTAGGKGSVNVPDGAEAAKDDKVVNGEVNVSIFQSF